MAKRDIVVIGGSMGAAEVLKALLAELPAEFGGSVFVATHVPAGSSGILATVLAKVSRLPIAYAGDGEAVVPGRIYLAPPGRHLLLMDGALHHGYGPRENLVRPSIDPLFRSAALAYGPRVVGVVLTGLLNDGAAGLHAVAMAGGLTVVQDPDTAVAPDMPLAACSAVTPDYVVPPDRLGGLIAALARDDAPPAGAPSDTLRLEVEIALGRRLGSEKLRRLADPVPLSCPTCDGVLSEVRGASPPRFRCQTGHAFTADVLMSTNDERVEEALRVALRVVEERVELVSRLARDARDTGRTAVVTMYEARHEEYTAYAETLRRAAIAMMRRAEEEPDT